MLCPDFAGHLDNRGTASVRLDGLLLTHRLVERWLQELSLVWKLRLNKGGESSPGPRTNGASPHRASPCPEQSAKPDPSSRYQRPHALNNFSPHSG
jgi:hypothetical protein